MTVSTAGEAITMQDGRLQVPTQPIIPFIEGDGTGPDIWRASQHVFDAAVRRAYGGKRQIVWLEVLAGEKAKNQLNNWLPDDTLAAIDHHLVAIKGPLTTPVGGGFRSLNVALRQKLDLYACVRPVRWFEGVPSPVKRPEDVDMVIFRENTEDIYAGIEYKAGSDEARRVVDFLAAADGRPDDPLPRDQRHRHQADLGGGHQAADPRARIDYAIARKLASVTLVHKGNIMKFTEGGFRDWGYELAREEYGAVEIDGGPWCRLPDGRGDQGRHRRRLPPADPHPAARVRRHRHAEPERRLHLRRARRPGGRDRHRAGRQHQLPDRPRRLRGHPRHRAQVRRPGQGEPRLGDPLRRDDVPLPGLERGGGPDRHARWRRRSPRSG